MICDFADLLTSSTLLLARIPKSCWFELQIADFDEFNNLATFAHGYIYIYIYNIASDFNNRFADLLNARGASSAT